MIKKKYPFLIILCIISFFTLPLSIKGLCYFLNCFMPYFPRSLPWLIFSVTICFIFFSSFIVSRYKNVNILFCLILETFSVSVFCLLALKAVPPAISFILSFSIFLYINLTLLKINFKILNKLSYVYYYLLFTFLVIVVIVMTVLPVLRHINFRTYEVDLGYLTSIVHETASLNILYFRHYTGSYIMFHFAPVLILIAGIYLIFKSPVVLLVIQSLTVYASILPLIWMIKRENKLSFNKFCIIFSLILYPALAYLCLDDFHPVTLGLLPLFVMIYAIQSNNKKLLLYSCAVSFIIEEEIVLCALLLLIYNFLFNKKFKKLYVFLIVSTIFYLISILSIMKQVRLPTEQYTGLLVMQKYGNSVGEIIFTFIKSPAKLLKVFNNNALNYVFKLLVPFSLFPIFGIEFFLVGAPVFLINLMGERGSLRLITYHYTAYLIPFIFLAFIKGYNRLSKLNPQAAGISLLTATVLSYIILSPLPFSNRFDIKLYTPDSLTHAINSALNIVLENSDRNKTIIFFNEPGIGPHLAHYKYAVYTDIPFYPFKITKYMDILNPPLIPDFFILVDKFTKNKLRKIVNFYSSQGMKIIFRENNLILLKK